MKFGGETEGMGEVYNPVVNMTIPVKFGGETEGMGEVYNPVVNMTIPVEVWWRDRGDG